jgi:hypothetical protein
LSGAAQEQLHLAIPSCASAIIELMPVDPTTLDSATPRTTDGRTYPEHLRAYETLDAQLLRLLHPDDPHTFDELSQNVDDAKVRAVLPWWIASARWRGLINRLPGSAGRPLAYVLTRRGDSQF